MLFNLPFYCFLLWNLLYSKEKGARFSFLFVIIPIVIYLILIGVGLFATITEDGFEYYEYFAFQWNRMTVINVIVTVLEIASFVILLKPLRSKAISFWIVWLNLFFHLSLTNYFINLILHPQRDEISWEGYYSVSPLVVVSFTAPLLFLGVVKAVKQAKQRNVISLR